MKLLIIRYTFALLAGMVCGFVLNQLARVIELLR